MRKAHSGRLPKIDTAQIDYAGKRDASEQGALDPFRHLLPGEDNQRGEYE
jgi:hypothetical protein